MTNVASSASGCWAAAFKQNPLASVEIVKQHATDWKNLFDVIFETPFSVHELSNKTEDLQILRR
jgi:hypothetical protein